MTAKSAIKSLGDRIVGLQAELQQEIEWNGMKETQLRECEARIAALEAWCRWQPIKTAPKGDKAIFWIRAGTIEDGRWFSDTDGNPIVSAGAPAHMVVCKYGGWSSLWIATHWMPMPEPPTALETPEAMHARIVTETADAVAKERGLTKETNCESGTPRGEAADRPGPLVSPPSKIGDDHGR